MTSDQYIFIYIAWNQISKEYMNICFLNSHTQIELGKETHEVNSHVEESNQRKVYISSLHDFYIQPE